MTGGSRQFLQLPWWGGGGDGYQCPEMMSLEGRVGPSLEQNQVTHPSNHSGVLALASLLLADCDMELSGKVWRKGSNDNDYFQGLNCPEVRQHGRVGTAAGRELAPLLVQQAKCPGSS